MSHTIKRNIITRIELICLFSWRTKAAYIHDLQAYHCLRMLGEHNILRLSRLAPRIQDSFQFQELELESQSQEEVWEKELWEQEEACLH